MCKWTTEINTVTLDEFKDTLTHYFPWHKHGDDYLELFFYKTYNDEPQAILHDEDLRKILRIGMVQSMTELIISLDTPTKPFSAWTLEDVALEYDLPGL
jgi:hypothetical protein